MDVQVMVRILPADTSLPCSYPEMVGVSEIRLTQGLNRMLMIYIYHLKTKSPIKSCFLVENQLTLKALAPLGSACTFRVLYLGGT